MTKYKRRWAFATIVAMATAAILSPTVGWKVKGWACGEGFYQGWPSSYHRQFFRADLSQTHRGIITDVEGNRFRSTLTNYIGTSTANMLLGPSQPFDYEDSASLPVLIDLLRDPELDVRFVALERLLHLEPAVRHAAVPLAKRIFDGPAGGDAATREWIEFLVRMLESDEEFPGEKRGR